MGCAASQPGAPPKSEAPATSQKKKFFEAYELHRKLGKGAFAQVRLAKCRETGANSAVKIMDLRKPETSTVCQPFREQAEDEATAWRQAGKHRNVVALKDVFIESGCAFFVMDLCEKSFLDHLHDGAGAKTLNEHSLGRALGQALSGLAQLHRHGVVHRDVKPDNLVVQSNCVRLCDFGLSAALEEGEELLGSVGTAPYMAPEMLLGQPYRGRVDVWSMGCLAYVLMLGIFPYMPETRTASEMKKCIRKGERLPNFLAHSRLRGEKHKLSLGAMEFLHKLLRRDPKERGDALDALSSPYIIASRKSRRSTEELSSLLPALTCAKRCGAFDKQDDDRADTNLDVLLHKLRARYSPDGPVEVSPRMNAVSGPAHLKHVESNETVSTASAMSTVPSTASGLTCNQMSASGLPASPTGALPMKL